MRYCKTPPADLVTDVLRDTPIKCKVLISGSLPRAHNAPISISCSIISVIRIIRAPEFIGYCNITRIVGRIQICLTYYPDSAFIRCHILPPYFPERQIPIIPRQKCKISNRKRRNNFRICNIKSPVTDIRNLIAVLQK